MRNPVTGVLRSVGPAALVLCATIAAYLPSLSGQFIWNDGDYVTAPALRSLHGLWRIWTQIGATQQYYPLLHSAFWFQHLLWGDHPLGYHIVTVLLHAGAAVLFALLLKRLAVPGAWLAALVFALHPVHVESVAWITEQKNTLSLVFYLGAALIYLDFDEKRRRGLYVGALALFVLSLWCKTVTATLPAALLVVFWWKRGRLEWRRDVLPVVPWIAVGAAGGLFTSWVERVYIGARGRSFATPFIGRVLVAGRAIAFYAGHLVWPFGLNFIYPRWTVIPTDWRQWLYPIGAAGFAGVLWAVRRRSRAPLAAYLLFVGALFPVLGFVNLYGARFSWVWDHWQYIADLAPLALASAGLAELWARAPIRPRWLGPMLATFIAVPLGLLTWTHCAMFGDDQTLYRATLARNPGCWLAHNNLGNVLAKIPGRLSDAIAQYEEALRIKPDYFEAHDNLANALAKIPGRLNDAIAQFDEALRLNPDFADAHDDLGNVLMRIQGRQNEAIAQFEEALRLNPDSADVHNNLGIALAQMPGRLNESIAQFKEVLRLEPDNVPVRENLGSILAEIPGRLDDAVAQYREALLLKPNDPMVHYNLGTILVRFPGRMNDAIFQFEQALRLDPGLADAHFNLAMAYLGIGGRLNDAIAQFEDSLRLRPDDPEARHYLALALSAGPGQGGPRGGSSPPAWK